MTADNIGESNRGIMSCGEVARAKKGDPIGMELNWTTQRYGIDEIAVSSRMPARLEMMASHVGESAFSK